MRSFPVSGLSMKAALILGFGLTLGLWLLAGYRLTVRDAEMQGQVEAVNRQHARGHDLLSDVRAEILMGSVYVRDHLLDPLADANLDQLAHSYRVVKEALAEYETIAASGPERDGVRQLRREVDRFRVLANEIVAIDDLSEPLEPRTRLAELAGQREAVLRVSDEVRTLNLTAFTNRQNAVAGLYASAHREALAWLGLASLMTLGIALAATLYSERLEDNLRRQRRLETEHAGQLQRLSAKLVGAQEEERRSIARALHDELAQVLTAIKMELVAAERRVEATGAPKGLLADAQAIADSALGTVRDLSHLLRPAMLDDLGLPAVLGWYVREYGKRHGIHVDFQHHEMSDRLQPEVEVAAYRIVQEGLTNVARHAQATKVRLRLQWSHGSLRITLEDNGIGLDPEEAMRQSAHRGLGLIGIRERASELLGTFRIDRAPGRGARLTIELPAHPRAGTGETEPEGVLHG